LQTFFGTLQSLLFTQTTVRTCFKHLKLLVVSYIQNLQQAFEDQTATDKLIALTEEYMNKRITRDEFQNHFIELIGSVIVNMPSGTVIEEAFRTGFIDGLNGQKKITQSK
jgi:hypothetical protein